MKFKIGDKVKVKEDLVVNKVYAECLFVDEMEDLKGQVFEIEDVHYSEGCYTLKEDNEKWDWDDEMLEPAMTNKEESPSSENIISETWICVVDHLDSKAQYKFKYKTSLNLKEGDLVIVDTKLGLQYAQVLMIVKDKSKVEKSLRWNEVEKLVIAKINSEQADTALKLHEIEKLRKEVKALEEKELEIQNKITSIATQIKQLESEM